MPRPLSETAATIGPYLVRERENGVPWKILQAEIKLGRRRLYQLYKAALAETDEDDLISLTAPRRKPSQKTTEIMARPLSETAETIGAYLVRERENGVPWKTLQTKTKLGRTRLYQLYKAALAETDEDDLMRA